MVKNWMQKRAGWKKVDVKDELLGSDEFGFMELEELDSTHLTKGSLILPHARDNAVQPSSVVTEKSRKVVDVDNVKEQLRELRRQQKLLSVELRKAKRTENTAGNEKKKRSRTVASGPADDRTAAHDVKSSKKSPQKQQAKKQRPTVGPVASIDRSVDVSAWSEMHLDPLLLNTLSACGFSAPTAIQSASLPSAIRDRRDIIGAAQTGSGKTLAFGLPILQTLLLERAEGQGGIVSMEASDDEDEGQATDGSGLTEEQMDEDDRENTVEDDGVSQETLASDRRLRALILAPTRELALQVCAHLEVYARRVSVWVAPIVGGMSMQKQERLLRRRPEIVVATPGRLWEHMREGSDHLTDLSALSFLVIDEADRMVQQGHYAELEEILARVDDSFSSRRNAENEGAMRKEQEEGKGEVERETDAEPAVVENSKATTKKSQKVFLQTFVFSATLTLPSSMRYRLKKGGGGSSGTATLDALMDRVPFYGRNRPAVVDLTPEATLAASISEAHITCPEVERDEYLYSLLVTHPGRTIVFVNAISSVRRVAALLRLLGLPAAPLHAEMQQRQRLKALDRFRSDAAGVLVATDVAARGLDIQDVACVVHYQLPASLDTYVHRSGRTARGSAEGLALALVTPKDQARYLALYRALGRSVPPEFPIDLSLLPAVRKRVRLAVRLDALDRSRTKASKDAAWRQRTAEELGIELSSDEEANNNSDDDVDYSRVRVSAKRGNRKNNKELGEQRGPSEEARAAAIKAELAQLLSQPLQPGFSSRYFTAGAAAALAARGEELEVTAVTRQAVKMAQSLQDSRTALRAATGPSNGNAARGSTMKQTEVSNVGKKRRAKDDAQKKHVNQREAALEAAVAKVLRGKKGRRGLVVVSGPALGRQNQGPSALEALRAAQRV